MARVVTIAAGTAIITRDAYEHRGDIVEVIFPASLVEIEAGAFANCTAITRITLAHTKVIAIGAGAFQNCESLAMAKFPASLVAIGEAAFSNCPAITELALSHTAISTLGDNAFMLCSSLEDVSFPASLAAVGVGCFAFTAMTTATLTATKLTTLAVWMFYSCQHLATVNLPPTLTVIEDRAFMDCSSLARLHLPYNLAAVRGEAFSGCTALTLLSLPASVTVVRGMAFWNCASLRTVSMESSAVQFMPTHGKDGEEFFSHFHGCSSLAAISVPDTDHAAAAWPQGQMFTDWSKPTELPALLAAASAALQLQYYWKPGRRHWVVCLPSTCTAVLTVLLIAVRLMHRCSGGGQCRTPPVSPARHEAAAPTPTVETKLAAGLVKKALHDAISHFAARSLPQQQPQPTCLQATAASQPHEQVPSTPDMPDEVWFHILGFIRRQELGIASGEEAATHGC